MESERTNNIKLLEYKKDDSKYSEENKDSQEKQKSNKQFLWFAKIFEGMKEINRTGKQKESIHLDLDSALQCLNLCMSYNL